MLAFFHPGQLFSCKLNEKVACINTFLLRQLKRGLVVFQSFLAICTVQYCSRAGAHIQYTSGHNPGQPLKNSRLFLIPIKWRRPHIHSAVVIAGSELPLALVDAFIHFPLSPQPERRPKWQLIHTACIFR